MSIKMIDHEEEKIIINLLSTASEPGPVLIGGGLMTILFSVEVFVFRNEKSFVSLCVEKKKISLSLAGLLSALPSEQESS